MPCIGRDLLPRLASWRAVPWPTSGSVDATELDAQLEGTVMRILRWLEMVAESVAVHKATPQYKHARARAGNKHKQSGFTAGQYAEREALRAAKASLHQAEKLNNEWNKRKRYWH